MASLREGGVGFDKESEANQEPVQHQQQLPEGFYPVATELEILVGSVLGSIPPWVTQLHQAESTQETTNPNVPSNGAEAEAPRMETEHQKRELVLNLKSIFGNNPRVPVIMELLDSLPIVRQKTKSGAQKSERVKAKKRVGTCSSSESSPSDEMRSKRTRCEENRKKTATIPEKSLSVPTEIDGWTQIHRLDKAVVEKDAKMCPLSRHASIGDPKEAARMKTVEKNSPVLENRKTTVSTGSTVVAEFLLGSWFDLTFLREEISELFPAHLSRRKGIRVGDGLDGSSLSVLRSFPDLIWNQKLFSLATNGASPFDPAWQNKIDERWAICDRELLMGQCSAMDCPFQHKRQYLLKGKDLETYYFSVGVVDQAVSAGNFGMSFLSWPRSSKPPSSTVTSSHLRKVQDRIPVYCGGADRPKGTLKSWSSIMRMVTFKVKELRLKSVQPLLGFSGNDVLSLSIGNSSSVLDRSLMMTDGGGDIQDCEDILIQTLKMIAYGTGELASNISCRQSAIQFLSNKLAIYPNNMSLWQLYLSLFLRDPGEAMQSRLHQVKLCWEKCKPWYRGIVMLAAVSPVLVNKIEIYREGILVLLTKENGNLPTIDVVQCVVDLAFRLVYLELSQETPTLCQKQSFCLRLITSMKKRTSSAAATVPPTNQDAKNEWYKKLLDLLYNFPEQRFLFCLSLLYGSLYSTLPSTIANSFSFPKKLTIYKWSSFPPNDKRNLIIKEFLVSLLTEASSGFSLFTKNIPMATLQVLLTNVVLLIKTSSVKKVVAFVSLLFPECATAFIKAEETSPNCFLDVAYILDKKLEMHYPVATTAEHHGHGFVLEHVMSCLIREGKANAVQDWSIRTELEFPDGAGYRVWLALVKLKLHFSVTRSALKLLAEKKIVCNKQQLRVSPCEKFFASLASIYHSILNRSSRNTTPLIQEALSLAKASHQELKDRIWTELMVLATAMLPTEDPRKIENPLPVESKGTERILFSKVREFLIKRKHGFLMLITIIKEYAKIAIPELRGLDNVETLSFTNHRIQRVLNPPRVCDLTGFLDGLLVVIPQLLQSEILTVMDILVTSFGTCPALAEFLIQIRAFVPDYDRFILRSLIQVLVHSVPFANYELWKQAEEIGVNHGITLQEELQAYTSRFYPCWAQKSSSTTS